LQGYFYLYLHFEDHLIQDEYHKPVCKKQQLLQDIHYYHKDFQADKENQLLHFYF